MRVLGRKSMACSRGCRKAHVADVKRPRRTGEKDLDQRGRQRPDHTRPHGPQYRLEAYSMCDGKANQEF